MRQTPWEACKACCGTGYREPDYAVVMLALRTGTVRGEPNFGAKTDEPMQWSLDAARRRVRDIKRAIVEMPNRSLAKPNSIVRVYLK